MNSYINNYFILWLSKIIRRTNYKIIFHIIYYFNDHSVIIDINKFNCLQVEVNGGIKLCIISLATILFNRTCQSKSNNLLPGPNKINNYPLVACRGRYLRVSFNSCTYIFYFFGWGINRKWFHAVNAWQFFTVTYIFFFLPEGFDCTRVVK